MPTARRSDNPETAAAGYDPVLYGQNPLQYVVAVQQLGDSSIRLYTRSPQETESKNTPGRITWSDAEFFPFFFLSTPSLIENYSRRYWIKELAGPNYYRYIVAVPRWNDLWEAIRHILNNYNKTALKRAGHYSELEPLLIKPDPVTQFLLQSGVTLFKGMSFPDLYRIQIALQTHSKAGKKSDSRKTDDRIIAIALSDSLGWEELLDGRKLSEEVMIRRFVAIIQERDPDVLEGHDIMEHLLLYLARRAELHSIEMSLGRDGSSLKTFSLWGGLLDGGFENVLFEIAGRHIVDTRALAHGYSISRRGLDQYGLRYLSQYFGFSPKPQPVVIQERVASVWAGQPGVILSQALQDCRDVRALSDHLSPSSFFKTQMTPMSYESIIRAGSAAKIELMMLREYIRQKHAVPKPQVGAQRTGAYTDVFVTGIVENVLHADIESLYPSIMLTQNIEPETDELGVFQQLLHSLTDSRLDAKHRMNASTDAKEQAALDAFQSSLKILINSFYGYLGYPRGIFNDFAQADRVTSAGQDYLRAIIREVELHNGKTIEADTDGLFFIPPDNVRGNEQELVFIDRLSSSLPEGIKLVLAGRYKKMLSYRKKNYALLDHKDRLIIRGSALISRSLERFAKNHIQLCINRLLQGDIRGLHSIYISLLQDITQHRWDVLDFCRTETIRDSPGEYERGLKEENRKPSAAYEVAKRAGLLIKPGDRVAYYVTGTHLGVKIAENCRLAEEWDPNFPDENTAYYIDRLDECSKKFELFFTPEDFKRVFKADDLFEFSPEGIELTRPQEVTRTEAPPPDDDGSEFGIWLDESG